MSQIGRRIYYDATNGNILCDTGERQGDVVSTTPDQDIATYTQLSGRTLANSPYLELTYAARASEFVNLGTYHVDTVTKTLVIYQKFTMKSDKAQIMINGVDTATITATYPDATNTEPTSFQVGTGAVNPVTPVNGVATLKFTTTVAGDFQIKATHPKFGAQTITVKGA